MRKEKIQGRTISLRIRYSDFKDIQRSKTLFLPTNDDISIFSLVSELFRHSVTRRLSIRLVGVEISNLCEDISQEELFNRKEDKWERILASEQKLKVKYGKDIIGFAASYKIRKNAKKITLVTPQVKPIAA
jgi:DNA polymerase-4